MQRQKAAERQEEGLNAEKAGEVDSRRGMECDVMRENKRVNQAVVMMVMVLAVVLVVLGCMRT